MQFTYNVRIGHSFDSLFAQVSKLKIYTNVKGWSCILLPAHSDNCLTLSGERGGYKKFTYSSGQDSAKEPLAPNNVTLNKASSLNISKKFLFSCSHLDNWILKIKLKTDIKFLKGFDFYKTNLDSTLFFYCFIGKWNLLHVYIELNSCIEKKYPFAYWEPVAWCLRIIDNADFLASL